jgi:MoaA/NifB/PqqE/SkfB family radical SAM enzyme
MAYVKKLKPQEFRLWEGKRQLLSQLDIELTERCNNACVHCLINRPEHDEGARSREMDTDFVKSLLRQAADLGCLMVRFTGGEPLLREDFPELYLYARRLGMRVILFTNGRLITEELADLLACVPPGRWVEVSVYGMHAASYDASAVAKGSFVEFRRGVERLRVRGIPFVVKGAILPPNKDEWEEFNAWAAEFLSMDHLPGESMNFDLRARRDDPAKNERIRKLRLSPEETVQTLARDPRYVPGMREFCAKFMGPPGDLLFRCGAGHGTCVDAYGNAQMCMPLRHPDTVVDLRAAMQSEQAPAVHSIASPPTAAQPTNIHGSANIPPDPNSCGTGPENSHTSGDHIMGSHESSPLRYALTEFFPRLRETRATNPEYLRRCARCFLKGLCEQCPGKSWMEHGTLDTPVEYLCAVAHSQARYLGLIKDGENSWDVANGKERIARFAAEGTGPNIQQKH